MATTGRELARELLGYVNQAPSPFHAVESSIKQLVAAGFREIKERDNWSIEPNGKYFFTRNRSSIVAFAVGGNYKPGNGIAMIGAHTDSPCLKIKPRSKIESQGYMQVGVELYGGGIWHTWFDRDLSVAGRAMVHQSDGTIAHKLVRINRPILRIPTLAIHLDRSVNEGFKFNLENELRPILGATRSDSEKNSRERHHSSLLEILSQELNCQSGDIADFELCLYDTQPGTIGGLNEDLIFAPRLDNLFNAFAATEALIRSVQTAGDGQLGDLKHDPSIRLIALFDNEEVGSESAYGAASPLLESTFRRFAASADPTAFEKSVTKSFLISADQAHGLHPNYTSKHEDNHRPILGSGVVVKHNANQRYATTAATSALLRMIAQRVGQNLQDFVTKNDMPCGSTIGPIISSRLGVRTVDVGTAQWSMHSIRETGSVEDVRNAVELYTAFFRFFSLVDAKVTVD